jgi:uncharacterized glyoxalase superfamily protein PhnB
MYARPVNGSANRSIPDVDVIPELPYEDVRAAAAWLVQAFGFTERLRIGDHRVQLVFGRGAMVAIEGRKSEERSTYGVLVRVADARAHYERAKQAGARVLGEPQDYPFGERQYSALDLAGHRWTFSQSIADVDPASWGGELLGN